jgi:CheY-like chemotaxis protein
MDGIMSTTRIRKFEKDNALPRVRIVALTCFSSLEYQQKAFDAGIDVFMVKPVLMKNLKPLLEMDSKVVVPPRSPSGD